MEIVSLLEVILKTRMLLIFGRNRLALKKYAYLNNSLVLFLLVIKIEKYPSKVIYRLKHQKRFSYRYLVPVAKLITPFKCDTIFFNQNQTWHDRIKMRYLTHPPTETPIHMFASICFKNLI